MTQTQFIDTYGIAGTMEALQVGNAGDAKAFAAYQRTTHDLDGD